MKRLLTILLRNIFNKKVYFISIFILMLLIFLTFYMFCYYDKSISNEYINNINNRILNANIKDESILKKVKENSHVNYFFKKFPNITLNINEDKYMVEYAYDKDLKNNEIIVASNCFNNKNIIAKYNDNEYQYYIKETNESKDCKKIYMNINNIMNIISDNNIEYNKNEYIIIIDKYSSLKLVVDELKNMNIEASLLDSTGTLNIENYEKMINLLKIMMFIFIVLVNTIIYFIINRILNEEDKNIGYMKVVGYKTKEIQKILTIRNILYIIIIYMFCFIITNTFVISFGKNIINNKLYYILCFMFLLILIIFIILISSKIKKIIENQSIINLIKTTK